MVDTGGQGSRPTEEKGLPGYFDLQHSLDRFAVKCEAAGMRISTSKSEAMVLIRKPMDCLLQVGYEFLPQVKEFK